MAYFGGHLFFANMGGGGGHNWFHLRIRVNLPTIGNA